MSPVIIPDAGSPPSACCPSRFLSKPSADGAIQMHKFSPQARNDPCRQCMLAFRGSSTIHRPPAIANLGRCERDCGLATVVAVLASLGSLDCASLNFG
jgi:hypothetical protein